MVIKVIIRPRSDKENNVNYSLRKLFVFFNVSYSLEFMNFKVREMGLYRSVLIWEDYVI